MQRSAPPSTRAWSTPSRPEQLERRGEVDTGAGRAPAATVSTLAPAARHASTLAAGAPLGRDHEGRRERGVEQRARRPAPGPGRRAAPAAAGARRRAGRASRTVSAGRSARAVPAPTTTACESARSSCASARAAAPGDPLRVPSAAAVRPSRLIAVFSDAERPAGAPVVQVRGERRRARVGAGTDADVDRDARASRSRAMPAARDLRVGIGERDDDPGDAGVDERVGAGRRAAVVRARLEGHVGGGAPGPLTGGARAPRPRRGGPPGGSVAPSPTTSPSRTTTHPTQGFGAVRRRPRRAERRARGAAAPRPARRPARSPSVSRPRVVSLAAPTGGTTAAGARGARRAPSRRRSRPLPSGLSPSAPAPGVTGSTTRPAAVGSRAPAGSDRLIRPLERLPPVGTCTHTPRACSWFSQASAIGRK